MSGDVGDVAAGRQPDPTARRPDRVVEVAPERLAGWIERFTAAHGALACAATAEAVVLTANDGGLARLEVPFPPLAVDAAAPDAGIVRHANVSRVLGILLVRRGGYAVAVAAGDRIVASKVGSRHVQGRTAAGGWSQQRFARRRDNQAKAAFAAAADVACALLCGRDDIDALVTGGDRAALAAVLADDRLAPLRTLVAPRVLDVPEPRQRVIADAVRGARAVRIAVTDPPPGGDDTAR